MAGVVLRGYRGVVGGGLFSRNWEIDARALTDAAPCRYRANGRLVCFERFSAVLGTTCPSLGRRAARALQSFVIRLNLVSEIGPGTYAPSSVSDVVVVS